MDYEVCTLLPPHSNMSCDCFLGPTCCSTAKPLQHGLLLASCTTTHLRE